MMVARWRTVAVLLSFVASGCGGDERTGSPTPMGEQQRWCDALATPYCQALFACCTDPTRLLYASVEACETAQRGVCRDEDIDALLADGRTELDDARLSDCVSRLNALASEAACTESAGVVFLMCKMAFRGTVPSGESCRSSGSTRAWSECEAGYCVTATETCQPFLPTGAACNLDRYPPDQICNLPEGEWCILDTTTGGHCGPRLDAGATCVPSPSAPGGADDQCLSGLCSGGQCQPPGETLLCG